MKKVLIHFDFVDPNTELCIETTPEIAYLVIPLAE
jgi:hypothetical protein